MSIVVPVAWIDLVATLCSQRRRQRAGGVEAFVAWVWPNEAKRDSWTGVSAPVEDGSVGSEQHSPFQCAEDEAGASWQISCLRLKDRGSVEERWKYEAQGI